VTLEIRQTFASLSEFGRVEDVVLVLTLTLKTENCDFGNSRCKFGRVKNFVWLGLSVSFVRVFIGDQNNNNNNV
jgi:hypothetical protein